MHDSLDLPPEPRAARVARLFVERQLRDLVAAEVAQIAVLLTSELVTNVVLHARSPMRLEVDLENHRLRVAVADRVPQQPRQRDTSDARMTGRGILLVAALAEGWGVDAAPTGKRVWFELPA